jgi:hypothetical protein
LKEEDKARLIAEIKEDFDAGLKVFSVYQWRLN